jgi:hypothetical protein
MRVEASGQILRMAFLGITAASTGVTALYQAGLEAYVPALLAVGGLIALLFAWAYVEFGAFARKNRERAERGQNFAKPQQRIDDEMIARGILAAQKERPLSEAERAAIADELDHAYREHRDGVHLDD